jgi:two-component system chemotaxis sensor kinase CheA
MLQEGSHGQLADPDRKSVQIIKQSGEALLELVDDILDFSKAEAGKREVTTEPVTLAPFLRDVEMTTGLLVTHKGLDFRVEVEKDVPQIIFTDHQALYQVIRNLLSNAAKFTRTGQVELRVATEFPDWLTPESVAEKWVAISVCDTGPGVHPERQEAIFEPFCQEDGTISREYGGTGLGLSISRQLAELMGGKLMLESQLGIGSTFTLFLPPKTPVGEVAAPSPIFTVRSVASTPAKPIISQLPQSSEQAVADGDRPSEMNPEILAKRRILVVDDDMRSLYTLAGILESAGATVLTAASGKDALQKVARESDLDMVIMDLGMPGMTGLEAIERLRAQARAQDLPILCMAGSEERRQCQNCETCPASGHITKPFRQKDLAQSVENLMPGKVTVS